jgi:hypothetical protein
MSCIAMLWALEAYDRLYQASGLGDEIHVFFAPVYRVASR